MTNVGGRIRYIDALRGTTMFLVVLGHVLVFSLKMDIELLGKVRMPTFFFISGYIAYKAIERWDVRFYWRNLLKKAMVQLIPTAFFFVAYHVMVNHNVIDEYMANGPGKYWFTVTLFKFFVCYFTLNVVAHYTRPWVMPVGMALISIAALVYTTATFDVYPKYVFVYTRSTFYYILYFSIGVMCRQYNDRFMALLRDDRFVTGVMVVFIALVIYGFGTIKVVPRYDVLKMGLSVLVSLSGVLVLFMFFKRHEAYFDGEHWLARSLVFIGRRTLDIYLIHYFFLPKTLWLKKWFLHDMFIVEVAYAVAVSAAVVLMCLLVSEIIRTSDTLGHYLLGAKRKEKQ